jgi:hypothetical protein
MGQNRPAGLGSRRGWRAGFVEKGEGAARAGDSGDSGSGSSE